MAHAARTKSERRGQNEVGAVRLQEVRRADVRLKSPRDQRHHIHQRFRRLAALRCQVIDFIETEYLIAGKVHARALRVIDVFTNWPDECHSAPPRHVSLTTPGNTV